MSHLHIMVDINYVLQQQMGQQKNLVLILKSKVMNKNMFKQVANHSLYILYNLSRIYGKSYL